MLTLVVDFKDVMLTTVVDFKDCGVNTCCRL